MPNDLSGYNPKTIWQNQPAEPFIMTLEQIQQKTRELHLKTRRELLRGMLGTPLVVVCTSACVIAWFDGALLRALCAVDIIWNIAGQYFLNRGMWASALPTEAGLSTGLESYQREVERRRYLSARFLLWSLGPVSLATAIITVSILSVGIKNGKLLNMIPFLTLLIIWIIAVFVVRMRERRELQREIGKLHEIFISQAPASQL